MPQKIDKRRVCRAIEAVATVRSEELMVALGYGLSKKSIVKKRVIKGFLHRMCREGMNLSLHLEKEEDLHGILTAKKVITDPLNYFGEPDDNTNRSPRNHYIASEGTDSG